MNCLVFGANGSIGKYVFDSFINEKYNVIGTTTKIDKIKNYKML
jgi:nucleoside-diphosphate-sugar epimerase